MDKAMAYVKKLNEEQKEVKITLTHVTTLSCAWGIYKMRRDIGRLPWGTFKAAKKLGVTILVDVEGGKDLVPVTIWDAHKMTIIEVAKFISAKVERAKVVWLSLVLAATNLPSDWVRLGILCLILT